MIRPGDAKQRIQKAKDEIQRWQKDIKQDKAAANQRHQLVLFGGPAPEPANARNGRPAKYEGRRVGMDFFQSPRGPPGDLRRAKDVVPGKHGLAGEYAGNREKENPWEWNCMWEEMGIPGETRVALGQEAQADLARGANQRRVIQDRGVYPAVQGEALRKEAERLQKEFAIERGKFLAARMEQAIGFDEMRDDVLQGRICWERSNGKWAIKGRIAGDGLILAARKGVDLLNETAFDFDRPAGHRRPHRQHEMLSQLGRAPTIRDVDQIPRPNPPYAWIEKENESGLRQHPSTPVHDPQPDRYPARAEWDVRSLLRGERRTVAIRRAELAKEHHAKRGAQGPSQGQTVFALEGCLERADDICAAEPEEPKPELEALPAIRLVERSHGKGRELKVLYPGGKRWRGDRWETLPASIVTIRHAANRNFGLNAQLLCPHADTGVGHHQDLENMDPVQVELALNPPAEEIRVFHHVGQLVQEPTQFFGGQEVRAVHGGSLLPPDRRYGVVNVKPPPTGKVIGGEWEWGDCGVMGADGKLLGRAHPFRDGNGDAEEHGALAMCKIRIAPNRNHGLNRHLLNPPPPEPDEKGRHKTGDHTGAMISGPLVPATLFANAKLNPPPSSSTAY